MSMQNKNVVVTRDIIDMGRVGIPAGLSGHVAWDEGGVDVIVEFGQDVPNGKMLTNPHQTWIARHFLKIID